MSDMDYKTALEWVIRSAEHTANRTPTMVTADYYERLAEAVEVVKGEQPTTQFSDILEWCEMHEDMFMDSGTESNHGEHTSWERFDPRHAAWLIRHVITKGLVPYEPEDYARDREAWNK